MLAVLAMFSVLVPQQPPAPGVVSSSGGGGLAARFVDFHADLDRIGFVAVVGTLQKGRDGRRKRLENGKLGDATSTTSVSGTQYFAVPVKAPVKVHARLAGKSAGKSGGKVALEFDVQLARLPDGKERRQTMTARAVEIETGMLALWVAAKAEKGRGAELLHVIAFDPKVDEGKNAEQQFTDAMRDFVTINQRLLAFEQGLADYAAAADDAERARARARLAALLDRKTELLTPELDALMQSQIAPWQQRARDRVGAG